MEDVEAGPPNLYDHFSNELLNRKAVVNSGETKNDSIKG